MSEHNFWSLTYDYFKKDVNKPEDSLIILVHWSLLKNNFKVLGPGSENEVDPSEVPNDSLPANWSQDITYKLRYLYDNKLFLLTGIKASDSFIINFYNVSTKHVSSAALSDINTTAQCVVDMPKNKEKFNEIVDILQSELVDPMLKKIDDKKAAGTQTQTETRSQSTSEAFSDLGRQQFYGHRAMPPAPFPSYGMPDLDPLGGLRNPGGGMIFQPDPLRIGGRMGNLPGVPPAARFDPMFPHNPDPMRPGGFRRPNPDHMRPPDFSDDMYM